jgi:hypothetical protein
MDSYTRPEIGELVAVYKLPDPFAAADTGYNAASVDAMCLFLARLRHTSTMALLARAFKFPRHKVSAMFNAVLVFIAPQAISRVSILSRSYFLGDGSADPVTGDMLPRFALATARKGSRIRFIWGFLDGSVLELCRPGGKYVFQRAMYSGHKM